MQDPKQLEGYDEMRQKFLSSIPPEERLKGLSVDLLLPALPVDVLRGFSEEYLRSLPPEVAEKIRQRLGR